VRPRSEEQGEPEEREEPLSGGFINKVVRSGDTVRRTAGERAEYVWELLELFERAGWQGAPRHLGTDEWGREVLSYAEGSAGQEAGDEGLAAVARLVREFHDLTAGTPAAAGGEVVCHNDLSPKNTVYREVPGLGTRPVVIIDWDLAAPGSRIHDVGQVCWQFCGTGPSGPGPHQVGRRFGIICDAYGLDAADRGRVVETVLWWQDRCWRGIEAAAEAGDPAMVRLRDGGAVAEVRAAYAWTATHRAVLEQCAQPWHKHD
jgi:hypothetical protein